MGKPLKTLVFPASNDSIILAYFRTKAIGETKRGTKRGTQRGTQLGNQFFGGNPFFVRILRRSIQTLSGFAAIFSEI
jgi:hypothetical protein